MKVNKYQVDVACTNCGHIEFKRKIDVGMPITNVTCKKCLCTTLSLFPIPVFISEEEKILYAKKMAEYAEVLCKSSKDRDKFLKDAGIITKNGKKSDNFNFNEKYIGFTNDRKR